MLYKCYCTVTMFSGIIENLVDDVEGASLPENLLKAPTHKFHVTPKDTYIARILCDYRVYNLALQLCTDYVAT